MSSIPTHKRVSAKAGNNSECGEYLTALFANAPGSSLVELRWRVAGGMHRDFVDASDLDAVRHTVARLAASTDVYLGVLPRLRRGGTRDDIVPRGAVLWVDCDTPRSVRALGEFEPTPSVTVASGTGIHCHAYWLLSEPIPLTYIETANRRLAHLLGADVQCADAARILRPPSLNHKHTPPTGVVLLHCDPLSRHRVDDVVGIAGDGCKPSARYVQPRALRRDDDLLRIEPAHYVQRLAHLAVPRDRKIACPFHDDRTPSLHVYQAPEQGWFCFGCGRGGSIYDFAAHLWRCDSRGADFLALRERLRSLLDI